MIGIQSMTTLITEIQYKAVLTNLVILTQIGPGGWAVNYHYITLLQ